MQLCLPPSTLGQQGSSDRARDGARIVGAGEILTTSRLTLTRASSLSTPVPFLFKLLQSVVGGKGRPVSKVGVFEWYREYDVAVETVWGWRDYAGLELEDDSPSVTGLLRRHCPESLVCQDNRIYDRSSTRTIFWRGGPMLHHFPSTVVPPSASSPADNPCT